MEVVSHHPIVRQHAVPGVSNSTGGMWKIGGTLHQRVAKTTGRLSWSGEGGVVQGGRCGLSAKWEAGSSILGRASRSCFNVLRYWLWPLRRSTKRRLAKERGFSLDPMESL